MLAALLLWSGFSAAVGAMARLWVRHRHYPDCRTTSLTVRRERAARLVEAFEVVCGVMWAAGIGVILWVR